MFNMTYGEMLLIGAFALLLFGSRLPEVARSLGGTYRELKKNLDGFQREFNAVQTYEPPKRVEADQESESESERGVENRTTAPKFAPPKDDD